MIALTRCIALAAAAAVALHAAPAAAEDEASFIFTAIVPPDSGAVPEIGLTGIYQDKAVGYYLNQTNEVFAGFVWSGGNYAVIPAVQVFNALSDAGVAIGNTSGSTTSYTTYDVTTGTTNTINFAPPGGCYFAIGGVNSSGVITATQGVLETQHIHPKPAFQPFEQNVDGSYTWLANSTRTGPASIGVTDDGIVVLAKTARENGCRGIFPFGPYSLYKNGKLKQFSIPGATGADAIEIDFVTGSGFGGAFTDTKTKQNFGFIATGAQSRITTYSTPSGSVLLNVRAIGPHSEVAGYTLDPSGYYHGFIYADKTYYTINYPKQKSTIITGFSSTGAIIGYFGDNNADHGFPEQPFIATCASGKGCTK